MKVQFKHPRKILGKLYHKGIHEVPEAAKEDWFFQAQVKEKHLIVKEEPKEEEKQPDPSPAASEEKAEDEAPSQPQGKKKKAS